MMTILHTLLIAGELGLAAIVGYLLLLPAAA